MVGWLIAGGVILILSVLLCSSVKVNLKINETIVLNIGFLGITLFRFDSSEENKPKNKAKPGKGKTKKETTSGLVDAFKNYMKTKNKAELVSEVFSAVYQILVRLKRLVLRLRFSKVSVDISVGSSDAAETAILYGKICSVVAPVVTLLSENLSFKAQEISVRTDFLSEKLVFNASAVVKLRIIHILSFALSSLIAILKIKIGEILNGRK